MMNDSKHTPGPWCYVRTNGSPTTREHLISGARPGYLAEVRDCGSGDVVANARLIAAAPDMLAALADAYRLIFETPREQVDAITWQAWAAEHSRALRAIAEGRQ